MCSSDLREAEVGSRTVIDVLIAQQTLLSSRVSLVQNFHDQQVAAYQLLAAMANNANFAGIVNPGYNANSLRSRVKEILDRADEFQQGDAESREAGSAALQIIERLKKTETPKLSVVSSGKK